MLIDQPNFLLSLAAALMQTTSPATLGSSLFVMQAAEAAASEPYAVLQYYGGARLRETCCPVIASACSAW